jgi:hypothetical protein
MLQTLKKPIILEDVTSDVAKKLYGNINLAHAYENFWYYRIVMNPRLTLREKWFPRSIAIKLRKFWFRAGKNQ